MSIKNKREQMQTVLNFIRKTALEMLTRKDRVFITKKQFESNHELRNDLPCYVQILEGFAYHYIIAGYKEGLFYGLSVDDDDFEIHWIDPGLLTTQHLVTLLNFI